MSTSVPDVVRPPEGNPRFPLFDALRAVAALLVVGYHVSGFWPDNAHRWYGGWSSRLEVGVTIFFVISGFLLYRPYVSSHLNGTPAPALGVYLRRRLLRILPAYWLALTVLAVYPGLNGVFTGHWWVYYGLLQIYHVGWYASLQGLTVAWSLCVEVSFYLALPLLALALRRDARRGRRDQVRLELGALGGLALVSIAFRVVLTVYAPHAAGPRSLPGTFDWFCIGMMLAVISAAVEGQEAHGRILAVVRRWSLGCWLGALGVLGLASEVGAYAPSQDSPAASLGRHLLYGAFALLITLPAIVGGPGAPQRFLRNRALAHVGRVSFGLYLWHLPILFTLRTHGVREPIPLAAATLAISLSLASASYVFMERPLLRLKHRDASPRWRLPGRSLAVGSRTADE